MKLNRLLLFLAVLIAFVGIVNAAPNMVKNYAENPTAGTIPRDNRWIVRGSFITESGATATLGGTTNVTGTITYTSAPTFNGGIVVNEDVDVNFDATDEEMEITTSTGNAVGRGVVRVINTDTSPGVQHYLYEGWQQNISQDADGDYLLFASSGAAGKVNIVTIASDGTMTIDADGSGSGTAFGENTIVVNDAAMDVDTETQDWNFGDGTNDVNLTDDGVVTFAGDARIDSETNDLEIGDGTNNTVVGDDGDISQTGDAQASLLDVTIGGTGLTLNSFSVLSDSDTVTISSATINICTKAGAMEIDLPDAATSTGKIFTFKKTDADASIVALDANGGTIDGADPYNEMDAQYDTVTIISDGTNWHIIAKDIN